MSDPDPVSARLQQIRERLEQREREEGSIRTHWDGCYLDRAHRDCALRIVLDHLAGVEQARQQAEQERDRLRVKLSEVL